MTVEKQSEVNTGGTWLRVLDVQQTQVDDDHFDDFHNKRAFR